MTTTSVSRNWHQVDPYAAKARDRAASHNVARRIWLDNGPHLVNGAVVVPTEFHPVLKEDLKSHGFSYVNLDPDCPWPYWTRSIDKPFHGKRYSAQAWLDWTRARYVEAWPQYGRPGAVWDFDAQTWLDCVVIEEPESYVSEWGYVRATAATVVVDGETRVVPAAQLRKAEG